MIPFASALGSLASADVPAFFGISPDLGLPPLWAYPASIALLILVGAASLGLAKFYVKIKAMVLRED